VLTVGLTGGVASGKSTVADLFVRRGAGLVDTDVIAREVVAPGEPGLQAVRAAFGDAVLDESGALDRRKLRALVFADAEQRRRLEALLHPLIRARTLAALGALEAPYAIVAVPLLVETGFGALVDRVLVVDCPEAIQIERLTQRDGLSRAEAESMLRAQSDRAARLQAADDVIDNGGSLDATERQVDRLHERYSNLSRDTLDERSQPVR
jgi:dephospho-CoA kinase